MPVGSALQERVRKRARGACEYCQMPQHLDCLPFQIDHIVARKHGGSNSEDNLALACFYCNTHKGPNIAGIDSESNDIVRLFDPRRDRWAEHFHWDGPTLKAHTAIGRVTIDVLRINDLEYVAVRSALLAEGIFPPVDPAGPKS
jgi:hypothetical protein